MLYLGPHCLSGPETTKSDFKTQSLNQCSALPAYGVWCPSQPPLDRVSLKWARRPKGMWFLETKL